MKYLIIISSILAFITPILIYKYFELKKEKEEIIENRKEEIYNQLKTEAEQKISNEVNRLKKVQESINKSYNNLNLINKEIEQKKEFNQNLLKIREDEIERLAAEKENQLKEKVDKEIEEWSQSAQEAATENFHLFAQGINKRMVDMENTYQSLKDEVEDFQKKRKVINQEILRERNLKLQQDAHRIILSKEDKEDITFLTTILSKINHKETLYKLIWSEYLIKPFQNMIKNSFGSNIPKNVIYCIESVDGKLKYIGKTSADVSKRWTDHIKTSLNIGGVSKSKLHDALYLHWDEFVFSVIEETTKEQLSEKEKYYINFFESDKYGLNIKSGG